SPIAPFCSPPTVIPTRFARISRTPRGERLGSMLVNIDHCRGQRVAALDSAHFEHVPPCSGFLKRSCYHVTYRSARHREGGGLSRIETAYCAHGSERSCSTVRSQRRRQAVLAAIRSELETQDAANVNQTAVCAPEFFFRSRRGAIMK